MKDARNWRRLDNAAKIFPPTTTKRDTKVFRFVCELHRPVEPELLQLAVEQTLAEFPLYRSVLKKGLFWYYFEESGRRPTVCEEKGPLCGPMYNADKPELLFRVTYYNSRINLEIFHALADGSGAMQFLRAMVYRYLSLCHPDEVERNGLTDYDASPDQRDDDAFYKYYDRSQKIPTAHKSAAYRIRGERLPDGRLGVMEAVVSTSRALELARRYEATLSELLTALLILAIYDGMAVRDLGRPVIVTVPVDLRRYFPTQTARNFFGVIKVGVDFSKSDGSLESVLQQVHRSFSEQLTRENLLGIINQYSALENNALVKLIPLQAKIVALRLAARWADREDTAAFSNVGRIGMPDAAARHIRLFDVFLSTKRPQICLCSFDDALVISISSPLRSTDLQRNFFHRLVEMGIAVHLSSNLGSQEDTDETM